MEYTFLYVEYTFVHGKRIGKSTRNHVGNAQGAHGVTREEIHEGTDRNTCGNRTHWIVVEV